MQCVLLVEDDATVRKVFAKFFRKQGWSVVEAPSVSAGWEAFVREQPSLVVIEHLLGDSTPTGIDLLKRIRTAGHSTYVVLNSGTDDMRAIAEAFDCGLDKFIPKPADLRAFCDVIDKLSGRQNPSASDEPHEVIGESSAAGRLRQEIRSYAAEGVHPVLVTGPTGAGKERVAQAIHRLSSRSAQPVLAVDCPEFLPASSSRGCSVTNRARSPERHRSSRATSARSERAR